jgi:hypothetical protein
MLKSLEDSSYALKVFAEDSRVDFADGIAIIRQNVFWDKLRELLQLLRPIHEVQRASESNRATLAFVFERWLTIQSHLSTFAQVGEHFGPLVKEFVELGVGTWRQRLERQMSPLHLTAFFLQPKNYDAALLESKEREILTLFKSILPDKDYKMAVKQFYAFRERTAEFNLSRPIWDFTDEPLLFWQMLQTTCPQLSSVARRLLTSIANSVPSERAWSAMNITHTKLRNRLDLTKVDKLQFISFNTRVLRGLEAKDYDPEQELQVEDDLIEASKT